MAQSSKLTSFDGTTLSTADTSSYRRLIGHLIYLTNTRPDIAFIVHTRRQFLFAPTTFHQQAASRLLRYLKANPGDDIFLPSKSSLQLRGFSDSDWATCPDTRKSITGYSIYLGDSLIFWKSKKQQTISCSSSEAEYRALATTTCELQWLTYLLTNLHLIFTQLATLYCDNQSAMQIASN